MKKQSKKNTYWLLITLLITLTGAVIFILYGHRYDLEILAGISFLMVFAFPMCVQSLYLEYKGSIWYKKLANVLIIIICLIPILSIVHKLSEIYYKYQLEKHPRIAHAEVIDFETTHGKSGTHHYATLYYKIDNLMFRQKVNNDNFYYKVGDRLTLVVSENDPEILRIIEVKR